MKISASLCLLLVATVCLSSVLAAQLTREQAKEVHTNWKARYNKLYHSMEEHDRRFEQHFLKHLQDIIDHNNGDYGWKKALGPHSDMSNEEFLNLRTGEISTREKGKQSDSRLLAVTGPVPDSVDWVAAGAVGAIKDQGQCGSCYAFGCVATIESAYYIKNKKSVVLSEQYIVDCDTNDSGCNGGTQDYPYKFLEAGNLLPLQSDYPYTQATLINGTTGTCNKAVKGVVGITSHSVLYQTDLNTLKSYVAKGPVRITICAVMIMHYSSGIISADNNACDQSVGSAHHHAVVVVGYNNNSVTIRNSWGSWWGEQGYFRFDTSTNTCGFLNFMAQPNM